MPDAHYAVNRDMKGENPSSIDRRRTTAWIDRCGIRAGGTGFEHWRNLDLLAGCAEIGDRPEAEIVIRTRSGDPLTIRRERNGVAIDLNLALLDNVPDLSFILGPDRRHGPLTDRDRNHKECDKGSTSISQHGRFPFCALKRLSLLRTSRASVSLRAGMMNRYREKAEHPLPHLSTR